MKSINNIYFSRDNLLIGVALIRLQVVNICCSVVKVKIQKVTIKQISTSISEMEFLYNKKTKLFPSLKSE